MNNQVFHIANHWALEKKRKNLKAQIYFDDNSGINVFLLTKTYFSQQKVFCQSGFYHRKQENHAIAKMTARCAQYMSALKIFESVD